MPKPKIKVLETWTDDHILCCKVQIDDEVIDLLWCGWGVAGAALYADESPRALADLMEAVKQQKILDAEDTYEPEEGE